MKKCSSGVFRKFHCFAIITAIGLSSLGVMAQDDPSVLNDSPILNVLQIEEDVQPESVLLDQGDDEVAPVQVKGAREDLLPPNITSVLFLFWEYDALQNVKKSRLSGGFQRSVTEEELERELGLSAKPQERGPPPPPEERELVLGGIAYLSKSDWTIWLNGQRITPNALPPEIIDLRVNKHYIDMKWLDGYTQQIFPIRLRSHQRFNLDSRIFLPG